VRWHNKTSVFHGSRRDLAGADPDQAMWFKYVDPDEAEGEHFEVYDEVLSQLKAIKLYNQDAQNGKEY
jgi:hypothetical protein